MIQNIHKELILCYIKYLLERMNLFGRMLRLNIFLLYKYIRDTEESKETE